MTLPVLFRRPQRRETRPVLVDVTNRWRVSYRADGTSVHRREVLARTAAGELVTLHVSDDHPAVVAFLERAAA
jgi:hypothetical protein